MRWTSWPEKRRTREGEGALVQVKLLFFAVVRELVGADEAEIELPVDVCTIQQLATHLEQRFEPLRGRLESVRLARNEAFASGDERIEEGDVIALIPPVAGG
jgi:molybdopterin synthase sulfur carrier subunit